MLGHITGRGVGSEGFGFWDYVNFGFFPTFSSVSSVTDWSPS